MARLVNYDGGVVATPERLVRPRNLAELQAVLADRQRYPSPVRAVGSFHSLTPCAATPGTMVDMSAFRRILSIDEAGLTLTAEAGVELVDAAEVLRRHGLQFRLNLEIGNITLGSAACCQTKDGLDGAEFGQANSYVTRIRWVTPSGDLREATEADPALLALVRSSNGLAGIVYEVTFRIRPLEAIRIRNLTFRLDDFDDATISELADRNQGMIAWTVGRTVSVETRNRAANARNRWLRHVRRAAWSHIGAGVGHGLRWSGPGATTSRLEDGWVAMLTALFRYVSLVSPYTIDDPDKIVDYRRTPRSARYAFTFWAFPRDDWTRRFRDYLAFSNAHYRQTGFRPNMPLGSYLIRRDSSSLLSYSYDGDILSIDPIHAPGRRDMSAWADFLRAFNRWACDQGGIPLLNQSPFVQREHLLAAYGDRWVQFSAWVRSIDPDGRMVNPFFRDLLC